MEDTFMKNIQLWKINPKIMIDFLSAGDEVLSKEINAKTAKTLMDENAPFNELNDKEAVYAIKSLLSQLSDPKVKDYIRAFIKDDPVMIAEYVNAGDVKIESALVTAAAYDCKNIVTAIVNTIKDLNFCQEDGWSPLIAACTYNNEEIVTILLKNDSIDVNAASQYGTTPLMLAAANGNANLVRILLDRGADPKVSGVGGYTALKLAKGIGAKDVIELLQ